MGAGSWETWRGGGADVETSRPPAGSERVDMVYDAAHFRSARGETLIPGGYVYAGLPMPATSGEDNPLAGLPRRTVELARTDNRARYRLRKLAAIPAVVLGLLLASSGVRADELHALRSGVVVLLHVDLGQTLRAGAEGWRETNPVLGERPAASKVLGWFGAWMTVARETRSVPGLLGLMAVQALAVGVNARRGLAPVPAVSWTVGW